MRRVLQPAFITLSLLCVIALTAATGQPCSASPDSKGVVTNLNEADPSTSRDSMGAQSEERPVQQTSSGRAAAKVSACDFPNPIKPSRVDNTCKAILDDVALHLQQQADTKLVVVGNMDASEKRPNLGAERAINVKAYLSGGEAKQAIDPGRIEVRVGSAGTKTAEFWEVPAGSTFAEAGTRVVDERKIKTTTKHPW